jgi:hypothetical protein
MKQETEQQFKFEGTIFLYPLIVVLAAAPLYLDFAWHVEPFEFLTLLFLAFREFVSGFLVTLLPSLFSCDLVVANWLGVCEPREYAGWVIFYALWGVLSALLVCGVFLMRRTKAALQSK